MGTTGLSITLANSIIGVGILAMPFCFQQCGVVLATLILVLMGLVSRLSCYFLLKSALLSRRRNFDLLAFHVFGPAGKLAVEVGIIGFLMGTCIAYFVVVGDLGPQIIAKMFNINQSDILRTSIMVIVSLVCVLPLGLLRNVDSLSNVSAATICFYFCLVMKVIADATTQLFEDDWHSRVVMWKPSGVLQCVPIFSMALFCQTQLFEIFESMPSLSLEKMSVVTKNAINICTSVYFTLGVFGYIAFSTHNISGNILMSLSPTMASDVIKLGFVMSVAFSFPLIIFPCRASLYSLLYRKGQSTHHDHLAPHSIPESTFRRMTVGIISASLCVSLLIPNIELVLGLAGSTIGVMVCVVFPAACFVSLTFKETNERVLAKGVLLLGLIIMVLGTYANLQAAENQQDKYDDRVITQERIDKIVEDFFESKRLHKEDVIPKPEFENKAQKEIVKNGEEPSKNSEFQPPNPVPPESEQTVEKNRKIAVEKNKRDQIKEQLAIKDGLQKPAAPSNEVNPQINGGEEIMNSVSNQEKQEETKDIIKKHEEKLQDKLDMMKQQQLIDTIKQHGEEQKELIKEQHKILHEIKKTKDELKQKQKDVDSQDTKKLAVESIQKIANIAIMSLNGVTDKPVDNIAVKVQQPIEIVEIAKKAVESIAAIQEKVKDEPIQNDAREILENVPVAQVPVQNNADQNNANVQPNIQNVQPVVPILSNSNIQDIQDINKNNGNKVDVDKNDIRIFPEISDRNDRNNNENAKEIDEQKPHFHSPDEPQSYKQGEDTKNQNNFVKPSNGIDQNVPLAVAMNNNAKTNSIVENKIELPKSNAVIETLIQNGDVENVANQPQIRQKREVVDCTERNTLKPEDKQICDTLVTNPNEKVRYPEEILPSKVDLNDALLNRLPIDANMIHRSLKSLDEKGR